MLAQAMREIELARQEARRTLGQRADLRRPIEEIDRLLAELEELHLAGRQRVPVAWAPRLARLLDLVPEDCRYPLRERTTIGRLMDTLFRIQDRLFDRSSTGRRLYRVEDEDL